MSSQPAKEWDEMTERQEILNRLHEAVDTRADFVANIARGRLERASTYSALRARLDATR